MPVGVCNASSTLCQLFESRVTTHWGQVCAWLGETSVCVTDRLGIARDAGDDPGDVGRALPI